MGSAKARATLAVRPRVDDRVNWPIAERTAPDLACVVADGLQGTSRHDLRLTTVRQGESGRWCRHVPELPAAEP
jgi:hypothetical protein